VMRRRSTWTLPPPAHGRDLAIGDRLEAPRAQHVAGSQAGSHPFRSDEVGVPQAQGVDDVVPRVPIQRLAAYILDALPERGKPVIAVRLLGPRLDLHGQASAVVVRKGRRPGSSRSVARTDRPAEVGPRAVASIRLRRYA
jgi:hypothetical protein